MNTHIKLVRCSNYKNFDAHDGFKILEINFLHLDTENSLILVSNDFRIGIKQNLCTSNKFNSKLEDLKIFISKYFTLY